MSSHHRSVQQNSSRQGGSRGQQGQVSMDASVEVTVIDHVDDRDDVEDEVHIVDNDDDEAPLSPGALEYYRPSSAASSSRASALRLSSHLDPDHHRLPQHRAATPSTALRPSTTTASQGVTAEPRLLSPTHRSQRGVGSGVPLTESSAGGARRPRSLDVRSLRHLSDVRQDTRIAEALLASSKRSTEPSPNLGLASTTSTHTAAEAAAAPSSTAAGFLEENVASRILQTFHSKDALIDELQWTLRASEEEIENLKLENDDLREAKKMLLRQWEAVVEDLNDRDQCERDRDQAKQEVQSLRVALNDANKALALQSDALEHQSNKLQESEAALRGCEQQCRDASTKIESLKFKNAKLLDELKSLAQQSDEANAIHEAAMKELQEKFRGELAERKAVADAHHKLSIDDQRRVEKLRDAEKTIASLREQLQALRHENDQLKHSEHESALHVAVQRDALDISERTLTHTEHVATAAVQELESLRATLADVVARRDELETEIKTLHGRLDEHRAALVKADSLVSEWRARCESTEDAFRERSRSDEDAKASYEATISELQLEVASCRATLDEQASLLAAHKTWEQSLSQEREQLSDNVVALEDTVENVERTAAEWKAKYTRAVEQLNTVKHEMQRRKVLHAAELRDMQELAATVAAGQSKQMESLTQSQQSVVKRLIDAEEELGRYTERCAHAEKALVLREEDVQQLHQELQAERRKCQSLSTLAGEKSASEKELREALSQLQKRFAHVQEGFESSSKRLEVVQELNRHQEARIAKAVEIEKRNEELQKKLDDAVRRAKAAEVELEAKKESLRNAREEKSRYVAEKENLQQQVHLADSKLKQALRRSDDKHRQLLVKTEHQDATAATLQAQVERLQSKESNLSNAVTAEMAAVLQVVVRSALHVVDQHKDFRGTVIGLMRRLADRYERDVTWLHEAAEDARRRYESTLVASDHLRLQVASLTSTCAALEQQLGDFRRGAEAAAQNGRASTVPGGADAQLRLSSDAVRSACHSISQEILGLPNGLQDLIELQQQQQRRGSAAEPKANVHSFSTQSPALPEFVTHPVAGCPSSAPLPQLLVPLADEYRDIRTFLEALDSEPQQPPRSATMGTTLAAATKRQCLEDLIVSDRLRELLRHSLRVSLDSSSSRESDSVAQMFGSTGGGYRCLAASPVRLMVEQVLYPEACEGNPLPVPHSSGVGGSSTRRESLFTQTNIPLRALLVTVILGALEET